VRASSLFDFDFDFDFETAILIRGCDFGMDGWMDG